MVFRGRTAFVLSGGGSAGAVQVGMVRALYEHGVVPDLLVGTSVGALNAAFLASRAPTPDTALELRRVWEGISFREVFPVSVMQGVRGLVGRSDHVVPGSGLRRLVSRWLAFDDIEEARIPLHVVATNVRSGAAMRLSEGPAAEAIMASSAIPGLLPPVRWGTELLVDGGLTANNPVCLALEAGADRVFVLPTGFACSLERPPSSALAIALHALTIVLNQQLSADLATVPPTAPIIVLPTLCPMRVVPIDFSQSGMLATDAYRTSSSFLDGVDLSSSAPGVVGTVEHDHGDH